MKLSLIALAGTDISKPPLNHYNHLHPFFSIKYCHSLELFISIPCLPPLPNLVCELLGETHFAPLNLVSAQLKKKSEQINKHFFRQKSRFIDTHTEDSPV